jgi:hypothetical protein
MCQLTFRPGSCQESWLPLALVRKAVECYERDRRPRDQSKMKQPAPIARGFDAEHKIL